jgi:hypothetical protein
VHSSAPGNIDFVNKNNLVIAALAAVVAAAIAYFERPASPPESSGTWKPAE